VVRAEKTVCQQMKSPPANYIIYYVVCQL
jgi:hypothetical protein